MCKITHNTLPLLPPDFFIMIQIAKLGSVPAKPLYTKDYCPPKLPTIAHHWVRDAVYSIF